MREEVGRLVAEDLAELDIEMVFDRIVGLVIVAGQEATLEVHGDVNLCELNQLHGLVVEAPHGSSTPLHCLEDLLKLRDSPAGQLGGLRGQGDPQRGLVVATSHHDVLEDELLDIAI